MNEIVMTLKQDREKQHDLVLPSAVPFAQLAMIFNELELVILDKNAIDQNNLAVSGRINDQIIVRPHETLENVKAKDGDIIELIQTQKGTRVINHLSQDKNIPFLKSLETDKTFNLCGNHTTIGRAKKNAICLSEIPKSGIVSGTHALIIKRDDEYWIEDKHSRNGTFVDGVLLQNNRIQIRHKSRIQFGKDGPVFYFSC